MYSQGQLQSLCEQKNNHTGALEHTYMNSNMYIWIKKNGAKTNLEKQEYSLMVAIALYIFLLTVQPEHQHSLTSVSNNATNVSRVSGWLSLARVKTVPTNIALQSQVVPYWQLPALPVAMLASSHVGAGRGGSIPKEFSIIWSHEVIQNVLVCWSIKSSFH